MTMFILFKLLIMKKIILKSLAAIFLLIVAVVFAIGYLNYYHVDSVNAMLCAIVSGCAFLTNVFYVTD